MTIAQLFAKLFGPVEREAEIVAAHVAADAHSAVHFAEKEFAVLSQAFQDALDHIKAALSGVSDNAKALQQQVSDANSARDAAVAASQAKDAQVADLTQKLADATQQIADQEAAVIAADPNAAPAQ